MSSVASNGGVDRGLFPFRGICLLLGNKWISKQVISVASYGVDTDRGPLCTAAILGARPFKSHSPPFKVHSAQQLWLLLQLVSYWLVGGLVRGGVALQHCSIVAGQHVHSCIQQALALGRCGWLLNSFVCWLMSQFHRIEYETSEIIFGIAVLWN